jgi:type VI secretion system protein ImpC
MLDPGFRELEVNWRSLRELVMRTETGQDAVLYLCDIAGSEISQDYAESESLEETRLFRNLVRGRAASGRPPLDLLLACYRLEEDEASAMVALTLASTAEAVGEACLTGGHEKLAGCPSLRSIRGREAIVVPMISSFHEDGAVLAGA